MSYFARTGTLKLRFLCHILSVVVCKDFKRFSGLDDFTSVHGTVSRYKAPDVKTNRKCRRRARRRQRTAATRCTCGSVLHQERASTVLGYGESDLRVYLLEGVEVQGSLLVTHEERVIDLTEATAKSGKSSCCLGHSCYFEVLHRPEVLLRRVAVVS